MATMLTPRLPSKIHWFNFIESSRLVKWPFDFLSVAGGFAATLSQEKQRSGRTQIDLPKAGFRFIEGL